MKCKIKKPIVSDVVDYKRTIKPTNEERQIVKMPGISLIILASLAEAVPLAAEEEMLGCCTAVGVLVVVCSLAVSVDPLILN